MQNIFGIRTLGKWLHFCHRSVEGPQSVASARSSSAVNSHKLISPPEIHVSFCLLTLNLLSHYWSSHQRVKPASPRQKHHVAKYPLAAVRITQQYAVFLLSPVIMLSSLIICSFQTYNPATFPVLSPTSTYLFAQLGRYKRLFLLFCGDANRRQFSSH